MRDLKPTARRRSCWHNGCKIALRIIASSVPPRTPDGLTPTIPITMHAICLATNAGASPRRPHSIVAAKFARELATVDGSQRISYLDLGPITST